MIQALDRAFLEIYRNAPSGGDEGGRCREVTRQ
jgi:hypothetical protein